MNSRLFQSHRMRLTLLIVGIGVISFVVVRASGREKPAAPTKERPLSSASTSSLTSASTASESALLAEVVEVQARSIPREERLSGQVEPYHIATVAAEVPERIVARPIEQGDRVTQGALLAGLDTQAASAALERAVAAHAQAVAARRQAETDYSRAFVETDAARQQARAQVRQASAGQQQARAQIAQASAGERKVRSFTRQQELRQAEAALSQARTDERLAKIEYDRYLTLVKEGAAPQQTLDRAQATFDAAAARRQSAEQSVSLANEGARQEDIAAAAAQVNAAEAQLSNSSAQQEVATAALRIANTRDTRLASIRRQIDSLYAQEAQAAAAVRQARINLGKHRVLAPFAGRVLAALAERGEMVAAGTPVARIGALDRVKVTFSVPEASRPMLTQGQKVTVTADALSGQTFLGTVTTLGFQADARSRNFPIEVTVSNPQEKLLPNMVARLRLPVGQTATRLLIPISAVATDGGVSFVYVLENGRAHRREVTPGTPEGDNVEIRQGLHPGEHIAATPQRLTEGAHTQEVMSNE